VSLNKQGHTVTRIRQNLNNSRPVHIFASYISRNRIAISI